MLSFKGRLAVYAAIVAALIVALVAITPAAAEVPETPPVIPAEETVVTPEEPAPVLSPREAVIRFSEEYGADVDLALCIVANESGFNPVAKNPASTAGGIWQFLDSTWIRTVERMGKDWTLADKYDMLKNSEAGAWLLAHDGYGHWVVWPKCVK